MNIRTRRMRLFNILSLLVLLILTTSCSTDIDATFGDRVKVDGSFEFYIASGSGQYAKVPVEAYELILAEPVWSVPEGLVLEEAKLNLVPTKVSWTVDDPLDSTKYTRYTVDGLKLTVDASVRVSEGTNAGKKVVVVGLPGLSMVASALGGRPRFPNDTESFTSPNRLEVTRITVHDSALGKYSAITGRVCLGTVVVVIVLAVLVSSDK